MQVGSTKDDIEILLLVVLTDLDAQQEPGER
jgi:hypothetical protein